MTRLRDLGIGLGDFPTGPANAITDVPGVAVGHLTLIHDEPFVARSGVTAILPVAGQVWSAPVFAGVHSFNGFGEVTGTLWLNEAGVLLGPVMLTATHSVGAVHEGVMAHAAAQAPDSGLVLPVVAETHDGYLSDGNRFPVRPEHAVTAIAAASTAPPAEGCVGGGTGMIAHEFKAGIGTASRRLETAGGRFTLGCLVQANYGWRGDLRLDGVPVGRAISCDAVPSAYGSPRQPRPQAGDGSIIVVLATDAPLLPVQCRRLAQRATAGLARTGGFGHDGSGDIFLAFSTGNRPSLDATAVSGGLAMIPNPAINPLFRAAVEATEEAIWNALLAATTTTGRLGRSAPAIPAERVRAVWRQARG
ncbi:MAG: P1 family peptidase [Thalassobaculales bacterium]